MEIKNLSSRRTKETPQNCKENQYSDRKIILKKEVEEKDKWKKENEKKKEEEERKISK